MEIIDQNPEIRLDLNEEIYGVITGDNIEFIHDDTTTYPINPVVKLEDLVPGVLFNYDITQEDIDWIHGMNKQLYPTTLD